MSISDIDDSQRATSLSWVKEEVDKSLDGARAALEAYVDEGDSGDESKLSQCQSLIRQVRGTLQMVQMQGAVVLAEEMESLVGALTDKRDSIADSDQAYEALMRAILQLPDYLERVQFGQSDAAIILLLLINDLRTAHGHNAVAAEALFAPNFNGILPEDNKVSDDHQDLSELVQSTRHRVHLSMLGVFRKREVEKSLNQLITLFEKYRRAARSESVIQMYWVIAALVEAIRDGGLEADMPVNPLLGQVDRQSKRIIDNGEEPVAADPPTELIRLLLFYVASSKSAGDNVTAIKQAFRLGKYLPSSEDLGRLRDDLAGPGSEVLGKVIGGVRQELDRARDMLDIYTRTGEQDQEKLELMVQALRNVAGTIAMVGDQELQKSINDYCYKLDALIHGESTPDRAGLRELAGFILTVDAKLQDIQSIHGSMTSTEPEIADMGRSGFKDVMSAVVRESSINMSNAKDAISEFAEAPDDKRDQLEIATGLLQQVAGSLRIASLDRASDVIYALRSYIDNELVINKVTPSATQMESLAEVVSSADYFLESVVSDLPNTGASLDLAEAALDLLGYTPDISSRFEALEDLPEEDSDKLGDEVIEMEEVPEQLDALTEELNEQYSDEESDRSDEYELDADEILEEEELGEVDLENIATELEEQDADVEEIEVAAPVETEEEIAERLASASEEAVTEELPTIEAIEESLDADIEEVEVEAPVETEEEIRDRILSDREEVPIEVPEIGGIEVKAVESSIEEVDLTDIAEETEVADERESVESVTQATISSLADLSPLGEDFDEEIVDIFLEEADEVIVELNEQFSIWKNHVADEDALAIIRRSFHTLKGSGRMVGANLIGEFSWEIEKLLNRVMDKTHQPDSDVLDVVGRAIGVLPAMVGQLQGGSGPEEDVTAIAKTAHAIVSGDQQPLLKEPAATKAPAIHDVNELQIRAIDDSSVSVIANEITPSSPLQSDELRKIYTDETRQHITSMRSFLEQCRARSGSCLFKDEQLRVIHTLHGGAATVGADEIKVFFDYAEPLVILHEEHKISADDTLLDMYERLIGQVENFLQEINGEADSFRADTDLLRQFRDRLSADENRLAGATDSELMEAAKVESADSIRESMQPQEVDAEPTEEMMLDDIEASLENLHELMSIEQDPTIEPAAKETPLSDEPAFEQGQLAETAEEADEHIDEEMFAVFLDEVGELLMAIEGNLEEWRSDMESRDIVINILRDVHTIKGGARMLEQSVLADISHAMETLLTEITDGQLQANEKIFSTLHITRDALQDIYEGLRSEGSSYQAQASEALIQQIESLRVDQPVATAELIPAAEKGEEPSQVAAETPEETTNEELDFDPELIEIFTQEARDLLITIDQSLHEWHATPADRTLVPEIQRDLHTLKGGARMVNLKAMGDLGHAMESLLASIADNQVDVSESMFKDLYEAKDELQDMFESVREGNMELVERPGLIQKIENLRLAEVAEEDSQRVLAATDDDSSSHFSLFETEQTPSGASPAYHGEETPSGALTAIPGEETPSGALGVLSGEETPSKAMPAMDEKSKDGTLARDRRKRSRIEAGTIRVRADLVDGLVNLAGETNIFRSRMEQQSNSFRYSLSELDQTVTRLRDQLRKLELETETQIMFRYEKEMDNLGHESFDPLEMDQYSHMHQLSKGLIESVGDLDSLQEMLGGLTRDNELLLVQQGRVNTELQGRLMQARVVPFAASLASRLRRIIRQTCQQLDKKAELRINGANEEMDRHVLDRMVAPLEHMLRNAIAHGIESPKIRKQRGKPEVGTVTVSVGREGGEIVIQVADDGGGLDVDMIRSKAESKGMTVENADMTDEDIMQLILQPGFSTAESVSQIAGRGVGMDVVHNEIRQLGGSLILESVLERGTAITVRLPFTLTISQALLVKVGGDLLAIPLTSIEGVSRIGRDEADKLMAANGEGNYSYGDDEYQISRLGEVLGWPAESDDTDEKSTIIMVRAGGHKVAFYVDGLMGHREIVVKALGAQISSVNGMAGGTILADGQVALILDIPALVRMVAAEHGLTETEQVRVIESPKKVGVTVMVVDDSITVRRVTTRLLERHDMEVVTAKDGVEALAMLEDSVPDVMLLDIEMPRMDGYEVASFMRGDDRFKDVPILMITSRSGAKHRERAEAIGVDRYLGKPYQESELLANISEVLEDRRH